MRHVSKLVFCAVVLLVAGAVEGQQTLRSGRVAKFKNAISGKPGKAVVKFVRDAAISTIESPTCPQDISLRIVASNGYDETTELPCGGEDKGWKAVKGGFKYKDKTASHGGIKKINYKAGALAIKIKGDSYVPLAGPLTETDQFVEVTFSIGSESYCGRFGPTAVKNDEKKDSVQRAVQRMRSRCSANPTPKPISCPDGYECAVFNVQPGLGGLSPAG